MRERSMLATPMAKPSQKLAIPSSQRQQEVQQQMPPTVHTPLSPHPPAPVSARSHRAGPDKEQESSPKLTSREAEHRVVTEQHIAKECEQTLGGIVQRLEQSEQRRFQLVEWVLSQPASDEVARKLVSTRTGLIWLTLADLGWFRAPRGWAGTARQADWLTPCQRFPGMCTKGMAPRHFTGFKHIGSGHQGQCCDIEGNLLDDRLSACVAAYDYHPPYALSAEHAAGTGQGPCLQSEDQVMQYLRQLYAPAEDSLTHVTQCEMWRIVYVGYGFPVVLAQMLQQLRMHARVGGWAGLRAHSHAHTVQMTIADIRAMLSIASISILLYYVVSLACIRMVPPTMLFP